MDSTARVVGIARVIGILGAMTAGAAVMITPTASAATLTCVSAPGEAITVLDGKFGCGSKSDPSSHAAALSRGGVGFAEAAASGTAVGVGYDGGVGAAEVRDGALGAFAWGPDSVAIGSVEHPNTTALVLSGPGGRAFVGDRAKGVVCSGGISFAANLSAGQGCFTDGVTTWRLP